MNWFYVWSAIACMGIAMMVMSKTDDPAWGLVFMAGWLAASAITNPQ